MLQLPESYECLEAAYNAYTNELELMVEQPDIPEAQHPRSIEVAPIYTSESASIIKLKEVRMSKNEPTNEPPEATLARLRRRRRHHGDPRA